MNRICHIILYITLACIMLPITSAAQQIRLLDEEVEKNPDQGTWGQNKTHYLETRLFYGMMIPDRVHPYHSKTLGTGELELQLRYKLKINPILSAGVSASYLNQQFVVKTKDLPDSLSSDRELFKINSLKSSIFLRFNIDPRRGNYIGKYIEAGFYGVGSYSLKKLLVNRYELNDEKGVRKSKEILSGLNYLNRFQYGTYVSIGSGNFEISYRYRMSSIFNEKSYPFDPRIDFYPVDFPKHCLGLSIRLNF